MRLSSPATRSQRSSPTRNANKKFNQNAIQDLTSRRQAVISHRSRMKFLQVTRKKSTNSNKLSLKTGCPRVPCDKLSFYYATMGLITLKSRWTIASSCATTHSMTLFGNTMALEKTLSSISTLIEKGKCNDLGSTRKFSTQGLFKMNGREKLLQS